MMAGRPVSSLETGSRDRMQSRGRLPVYRAGR